MAVGIKYVCRDCGKEFVIKAKVYRKFPGCLHCGSQNIARMYTVYNYSKEHCDGCGQIIGSEYVVGNNLILCLKCFLEIYKQAIEKLIGVAVIVD